MPLFRFDPNDTTERPFGLGTTFRIDPWGNCATAFHVIEDMLVASGGKAVLRENVRVAALEIEGILFGAPPLPNDAWRPLLGFYSELGITSPPLLHQKPCVRNITELACLTISRSERTNPITYLPIALRAPPPKVGDEVTGYGFAGLDVAAGGEGENRPMTQYLYQSTGKILEVIPPHPSQSMPWPKIRVKAEWPSGMSGGPVLNSDGQVIGVISRSWEGEADSTATHFAGWNVSERTFASIDPLNVGRFRAFAAIDQKDNVVFLGQDRAEAERFATATGMSVRAVSCNPNTGDWVSL